MEQYEEIRIEIDASEMLDMLRYCGHDVPDNYKHNNTFIQGLKDIGLNGHITFVLRKDGNKKDAKIQK